MACNAIMPIRFRKPSVLLLFLLSLLPSAAANDRCPTTPQRVVHNFSHCPSVCARFHIRALINCSLLRSRGCRFTRCRSGRGYACASRSSRQPHVGRLPRLPLCLGGKFVLRGVPSTIAEFPLQTDLQSQVAHGPRDILLLVSSRASMQPVLDLFKKPGALQPLLSALAGPSPRTTRFALARYGYEEDPRGVYSQLTPFTRFAPVLHRAFARLEGFGGGSRNDGLLPAATLTARAFRRTPRGTTRILAVLTDGAGHEPVCGGAARAAGARRLTRASVAGALREAAVHPLFVGFDPGAQFPPTPHGCPGTGGAPPRQLNDLAHTTAGRYVRTRRRAAGVDAMMADVQAARHAGLLRDVRRAADWIAQRASGGAPGRRLRLTLVCSRGLGVRLRPRGRPLVARYNLVVDHRAMCRAGPGECRVFFALDGTPVGSTSVRVESLAGCAR